MEGRSWGCCCGEGQGKGFPLCRWHLAPLSSPVRTESATLRDREHWLSSLRNPPSPNPLLMLPPPLEQLQPLRLLLRVCPSPPLNGTKETRPWPREREGFWKRKSHRRALSTR